MKIVVFAVCALTVAGAAPAVFALAARTTYTYGAFRQFGRDDRRDDRHAGTLTNEPEPVSHSACRFA